MDNEDWIICETLHTVTDLNDFIELYSVEQEQIQKRTFTNWVNAQLAKRRPPCMILDLFSDFRDGSKLLDLLEVMSGQRISRERGRGMFQHRSNIEKALSFLKKKSIKLVNINIPDIIDGRPSIILGLIWTIILQYHIEELASSLSFDSRQGSMESLASLDSRSTLSSRSASSSPLPPRASPLHNRFRVSAKKALMLWVREQCHRAGCSLNVKDFKSSWRSGVVFLAILYALRPDLVDLSRARTRSNRQNLEEAFRIAERELRIPRLLEPDDVDVRDPDEKSIMTYVAQFLQYSRDLPPAEDDTQTQYLNTPPKVPSPINLPVHYTPAISASPLRQATPDRKAQEVTLWLVQAYDELLEGWDSTEGESYSERYHVFQTFLVSFNEQRRPIMPLLTAMRRTPKLSDEQRNLREAWDTLTEKLREYRIELDMGLPPPLDTVARWLLKAEGALAEEQGDPQDHGRAADEARENQELLKVCLEEMPQQLKTFQSFQNLDEYGNMMVPADKIDELKRRFTGVRVTAKYHGIKLEYREHRHTVLDLLGRIRTKLLVWKRPFISPEAVRVLLQEWHELINRQELSSLLEAALHKLKQISEKYSSKSALAADYTHVSQQVKQLEESTALVLEEVTTVKSTMGRVLSAWDSYSDGLSSLQAWLEQSSAALSPGHRPGVSSETLAEWGSRQAHLNEVGNFLIESTDPQTSRSLAEELRRLNMHWAEFVKENTFDNVSEPSADVQTRSPDPQALIREATLILKEPLEAMASPLRTYRKRIQYIMRRLKEVDLEALAPSPECSADQIQKLKFALPDVIQTLFEVDQVCVELQHSVSGLDSRLAELLHWETEARELYQLLRAAQRQQRGQDPRARALISRGLQLEGQVVTEEQDLQMVVMTNQKSSPIRYLHASAMQDRVRAAVAQSQEAVGMLSSLGARRDRSSSPPEGIPPSKVFIQAKDKPQHLRQPDTRQPTQKPGTNVVPHQSHETFVPKIVVQEYKEVKTPSPPMPYTYAQALMQTRTKSPPEGRAEAWSTTVLPKQQQSQEQRFMTPQQQQEKELNRQKEKEIQQQELKQQKTQTVEQQELRPTRQQQQRQQEQQQIEKHQYQVQEQVVTCVQVETQVKQVLEPNKQPRVQKGPISSYEVKSRKTQAMKNRPWLQKPVSGEIGQDSGQDQTQGSQPKTEKQMPSVEIVPQQTGGPKSQPEANAKAPNQSQQQQKEKAPQPQIMFQQQPEQRQDQRQQETLKQPQQPQSTLKQTQPDFDAKAKSETVAVAQPLQQSKVKTQSMVQATSQTVVQLQSTSVSQTTKDTQHPPETMSQTRMCQVQSQTQVIPPPKGPVKTQLLIQPQTQTQTQTQLQSQALSQTCIPAEPQFGILGPPVAQVQTWAQVRSASPVQAPVQGQMQPPVPFQFQLHTHPQFWAPVRPPSPRTPPQVQPQMHTQAIGDSQIHAQSTAHPQAHPQTMAHPQAHPQSMALPQAHPQSMAHPQTHPQPKAHPQAHPQSMGAHSQTHPQPKAHPQAHPQSMAHPQTHPQPKAHPQAHPQSMAHPQAHPQSMAHPQAHGQGKTHIQSMAWQSQAESLTQHQTQAQHVVQPQVHSQHMTQYSTHAQPPAQLPGQIMQGQHQAWTQVRASSPISVQHPQAQPQLFPQGYPQAGSPSQQWTHKHELQNQAFNQQRHPIPQPYVQQIDQASQAQAYSTVQVPPQWIQTGPQQGPQIRTPGYSHMGQSYTHPERQPHIQHQALAQTPPQIRPQSPMQQQMRAYNIAQTQGQVQPQICVRQRQPHPQSPSQQCPQVPHQPESQHHPQTQIQIPQQSQAQPTHPQFPSQPQVQTERQASSQTLIHTQPPVQAETQAQTQQPQLNVQFQEPPPQPKHQTQLQPQLKIQSAAQPKGEMPSQPKPHDQLAPKPEAQSTTQTKTGSLPQSVPEPQLSPQPRVQLPITPKDGSPPQSKSQAHTAPQPEAQIPTQPKAHSQSQPRTASRPQHVPESQFPPQPTVQLPTTQEDGSPPQSKSQAQTAPQPETQSPSQTKVQLPAQLTSQSMPQPIPQAQPPPQPQLQAHSPPLPKAQPSTHPKVQSPPQARPQIQPLPPQPKTQQSQTIVLSQVNVLPQSQAESPDLIKPPALAQAPPQAYTEAYAKAQALARNGFEEAKHCLQEHILEAINVFRDKRISAEQVSVKEETLRTLDPELLEEFLRAAKGMEAFCTPPQLRDMEFFTQSVRSQWEACFAADGSFAQAGQHLQALKELCDTLSPEDAHRLAQTQLRECEKRLAAIQHQFSGEQDAPLPDPRIPVAFSEDVTTQEEHEIPQVSAEVSQVTVKTVSVERREVEKQTSVEEEVSRKEALERYENCKRTLQAQLSKNEQILKDIPSDSVSLKGLHTRLQEIQFLRQETESLWSEYGNLCSQRSQLGGNTGLEQEKTELQEQWRTQQCNLQRRGSSLGAALRQIDSTENHMVDFTDRLDRYLRQPKDISAFTLANTNILKDIKELDENIQSELDQLSRLDPESSDLDPRDCFPLSREVETHRTSLDQLRQQVRKSEASARALDRFLMSLRTVDEDISGVQGAPCSDATVLQDARSKLALIRQSIDSLIEKAPQLDLLLQGARLTVTRDGVPASCLDMVTALLRRLEEADSGLAVQQQGLVKETQSKSLGLRKRALLAELRKLQDVIESQGLKEANIPAVHHRLRALSDLEVQLQAQHAELQNLRELQEKQGGGEQLMQEVDTQWKETHKGFSDRKKRYAVLLENLKKFQSSRSHLSNTLQRVEQTIGDQASYMGKDNLHRSITKFSDIKEELTGLREPMEEMRGVCKQLQSQLKTIPDCSESAYEAEADTLMDNWLDVTEKTDACMDNLKVGVELWEKQLMLGGEVDNWAGAKLALFAASHPFYNEKDVLAMRDEIHANEENIEHFHKKSVEIQEMLQSQEAPLELQVMETQLRKRMEQVKELFTDCTDVFEELIAVKKHLAEKIDECQSTVQNIQGSLSKIDASGPNVEVQIQDLVSDLETQEQQAEAVMKEVGLVSSVASPQVMEALSVDCSRLIEAISRTKDMIHLKREERDKGLLKVLKDERQSFEEWFQDLQLCVNECFENPESKTDVETSLQRLTAFLKSKDAERRLDQMKVQLEKGREQIPPQQLSELGGWMKEQQEEVGTFRTHCHNRQQQMESLLSDLNSLQKQHDSFREWLQTKEKQSVASDKHKRLLKELQDESGRAETLSELLASVRRQGVRAETLLKDGDNLIQRYRNLEARLQKQTKAQSDLEGECNRFDTQAESTRTWIRDLLQPLSSTGRDVQTEETRCKAQTILSSKPEGDSKMTNLRRQSQSLCEQEELDESRRQQVLRSVREAEEQWTAALHTAEEALNKVEAQALLDKDMRAFKTQSENVQSWIRDQEQNLQSVGGHMPVEEKLHIAQATLNSKPEGESKLHDLKQQGQRLCDKQAMDDSRRREVQDAVTHREEQWRKVMEAAGEALHKAEADAASDREFDSFKTQSEQTQTWMKEQKQKLLSLSGQMQCEQRLQVSQAVLSASAEGESKVLDLKRGGESLSDGLEPSRRSEVQQLVENAEQQWRMVLQAAGQAELRGLSDDFDTQSKDTQSWIRDRQQKLQSAGCLSPPEERCLTAQSVLGSRPEGDCQVNNLRRRGQSLCDHRDADEGRRLHVQQTVRDTEEQWRALLQAANRIKDDADAQIAKETGRRSLELREFDSHQQDTRRWLADFQQRVSSLSSRTKAEDKLLSAQDILLSKPEGDSKLQELKRRGLSLSGQDLEEQKKQEVESRVRDAEDQWTGVLQEAKQALDQAEKQCALEGRRREYETLRESTRAWLQDKQQSLVSLDAQMDPEEKIMTAQTILSSRPEGDSKLTELRRRSQSLSDQEDLEEDTTREAEQTVKDSEEQWRTVLQTAENTLKEAEVQYSLSREMEALCAQAGSTKRWVEDLQEQAASKGKGPRGSQAQLEDRLSTAQVILSSKSDAEAQVTELKRRAQGLCEQTDLEGGKKLEVQQKVSDIEEQWRTLLRSAEETQRELKVVVKQLASCRYKRGQAEAQLAELQKQTSDLPLVFPWPGLGERRQAVEQVQALLDRCTALAPVLSDVCTQAAKLFEVTQDRDWADPSWAAKEESIPALLKELTAAEANLEQGILTERQCTQLVEQHEAAQDWLREHVKGLGAPPEDREGLHGAVNTLKALLQTVDREQREMKELDSARDKLLSLCSPGGRDSLTLEVRQLHDLCDSSEQEVRERLTACELRLEELERQSAKRSQELKERAAALQWELRSLDQALSYSEPQHNITQLQQHWHSLQNCEKSLEGLGVKVHDLHQEVKSTPSTNELPAETISVVESLCQQQDSLKSRLSEHQEACSTNTARSLTDWVQALHQWNHSKPSDSISTVQVTLEEGEKLQIGLREALSHQQFLAECLTPVVFEKLEKDGSETLREADTRRGSLNQSLKELEYKKKQKLDDIHSIDVLSVDLEETKTSLMAPPRKSKRSPEKKSSKTLPSTEKTSSFEEDLTLQVLEDSTTQITQQLKSTRLHVTVEPDETEQVKAAVEEQRLIQKVNGKSVSAVREETTPVPSRRKTKAVPADTEPVQCKVEKVATVIPDVSKPSIPAPVSKDVTGELTEKVDETLEITLSKSLTEQARTTAKLRDTSEDAIRPEVSLEITDAKPTPIQDDSEPITKTVPKISQVITEPTDLDESKLLPKSRKSKSQKPTDEPDSQTSLTNKEQTEATPMDTTIITPSGKSKVLGLSIAPEPVSAAESSTCVVSEPEKPIVIAVSEQIEVLPPKRKSKSPNLPQKHTDQQKKGVSDHVEPEDGKKESSTSTSQEVSITTETIFKISPTKRRSKGPTLFPEQDTKEGGDTKQEPDSQKPSRQPTKEVVEETKVIPIRRKSKTVEVFTETEKASPNVRVSLMEPKETTQEPEKDPTDIVAETTVLEKSKLLPPRRKPKSSELPLKLAETEVHQTVEDPEGQKAGEATNKVTPTTRKSKGPKVSPDLPHKVETHSMEKPESPITETTIVEETKVTPSRRKSKEHPDSQKSEPVAGPAEIVVEKGKLSPTKRKSKGTKHLTEVVTQDVAQIKKETDVQKSQIETVIIVTTDGKCTISSEELQTAQVVVGVPESTIVEEVKLLPPMRKSKDPKVSPELPHKKENQAMEMPESQDTFSITLRSAHNEPEQIKEDFEGPVVAMVPEALPVLQISSQQGPKTTRQKSELSDIRPVVNKDVKSEITVQVQGTHVLQEYPEQKLATIILDASEVLVIADTHPVKVDTPSHEEPLESISSTLPKLAVSESQEPKDKSEKAPEQTIHKSTDQSTTPETQPHPSSQTTDALYGTDYVDKLWRNSGEIQKRYLVLDMPDIGFPQTSDSDSGSDSSQPTSIVCAVAQPHDREVDVAEISRSEQEIMKLSESLSQLKLTQERPKEDKEHGSPGTLLEKSAKIDRIHNVAEVNVLKMTTKPDIHKKEIIKVSEEKEDEVDFIKESVILCEAVPESKDMTSSNAQLEKTAVKKTVMKIQESSSGFPDTMALPTCPASEVLTPDQEGTTGQELKVLKKHGVQEQPPTVWTYFMDQPAKTLEEKTLKVDKIHLMSEVCILQLDIETATEEHGNQEPRIEIQTSILSEEVPENTDKAFADVEPEKAADVMTETKLQGIRTECKENVTQRDSAPPTSVLSELLQPYETETEFIEINLYEQDKVKPSQSEIKIEVLKTTQDRRTEVREQGVKEEHPESSIHGMDDVTGSLDEKSVKIEKIPMEPQEHLRSGEKISPAQKASTDVSLEEVTRQRGLVAWENKEEERVVKKLGVESAESAGIRRIFSEVQLLAGTGPGSEITEVKSHDDTPETLITSTTDMDERVNRLVSQILSCKNRRAELSAAAMARQVEEAQQCREFAQAQGLSLSQLRGAESEDRDSLEHLEDQWSAAAQDAAAVIQSKEAQLELVMDYGRQTQAAQTTVERLAAELDALETSKEQSSSKEAEHLCSFQRSMEDNRTVLGELLVTLTKLCPFLSQSERSKAQTEQRNLHERWRGLERDVERSLHHTKVHSHETSSLKSEISNLREHLETIDKDLEAKSPAATQWNCKKAQQLMEANAEVKAAKQKFLYLQKLSEALMLSSRWDKDTKEIQQGLQMIQDKLSHTEELVSSQTQSSSNPIMENIITVMRDGLSWAKQTESDIEGRRKMVALLPEEVHRQLRDLKKLQSEVMSKQGQLESLVEEVTELLPQLDQVEEVPVVRTSLQTLQKLSHSTTDKLANAVREIESGLQTREKMSEQIVDLDSWVVAQLHREASRSEDSELRSPTELDRRVRQLQETLAEADKQSAVCEALLMKSKDISSELSISEKCQLFEKLTNLQDDIRAISSYEKVNKKELDEVVQTRESNKKNLLTVEQSLRQMAGDLSRHRFPITTESLQPLQPLKHMILEHKSQVDLLQPWIPQEKTKELHSVISEIHNKLINLETKARDHEKYLSMRQRVEDLREEVPEQVRQTKDDSKQLEDKYRICQNLIVQIPLIKWLCEEARSNLQMISADLYPSQLATEQQRLKQSDESLDMLQITLYNNLSIIEWNLLKELDLESVKKDTEAFLSKNQQELGKVTMLEPNETAIDREYQRTLSLKKTIESRIRALDVLQQKKGKRRGSKSQDLCLLQKSILSECDSKMENLLQARESWRSYTRAVKRAVQFLRDIELCLLTPCGSTGPCSERLEETQKALVSLQQQFQTHVEQLQSQFALHPYLSPQKTEQLQENILSQLLVRMSTLQAKGHVQLESLSRCAEHHRSFNKSQDEIFQRVKAAESILLQFISQKPACLSDCTDQEAKLRALSEEVASLLRRLEEMNEWCPEQSCHGGQEATVTALWRTVSRLRRCTRELAPRSKQKIAEWSDVTSSVEKASAVLELVEAELPEGSQVKASTEELQDVLQSWEQYQDRLDCEHRSLSALELRAARMLGVPAHLEQAPPTPLCQQLQAMQARYSSVKQRSKEGLESSRLELQEREKVWKDLQGVRVWLEAADGVLSEMEKSSSTQELQEVHGQLYTQKALLLRIMESMKMKYSDMDTLVPVEIEGQLQEVNQSLQQVEVKVGEAVKRSGPVHRLGAKLSEIEAGLRSVQKRLEQRTPTVIEAKVTQKRVWDELDVWHSCLAALEVDMQDLDKPEEALSLTERMVEVQQRHSQLAKQAEQRTTLLSKTPTWLQEHREMISSSESWMSEAQSWLAAPCTYTSAKCLSSHVHSLQMVLGDSAQIRTALQGFSSVLKEMSQIRDVTILQQQLVEADRQVADVQDSFTAPLSQLEHAAAEVEAIESEVKRMENDVAEIKTLLSSPETFPSPREESLKEVEKKIESMSTTVAEIQRCKPDLCLPEKSEETLTVFTVVDQLQNQLLELEKKVPALFIQQPPTPVQTKAPSAEQTTTRPQLLKSTSEESEKEDAEEGHIKIVHVEENVLTRLGATLQTVERPPPEQRLSPEEPEDMESEETEAASGQSPEEIGEETQDVQETSEPTEASSSEALSRPVGTVSTQSLPESMVNTPSTVNVSKAAAGPQQRCVVS